MTAGQFVQFVLLMGCLSNGRISNKKDPLGNSKDAQENGSILVQFSTNGGITWKDLKVVSMILNSQINATKYFPQLNSIGYFPRTK